MSEAKLDFWKLGEHYRVETPQFMLSGVQLTGLSDSELEFQVCALSANKPSLGFAEYFDSTKRKLAKKFVVGRAQVVYAEPWDLT